MPMRSFYDTRVQGLCKFNGDSGALDFASRKLKLGGHLLLIGSLSGCIAYPSFTNSNPDVFEKGRVEKAVDSAKVGITTEQEVVARLGEPDLAFQNERIVEYDWHSGSGIEWFGSQTLFDSHALLFPVTAEGFALSLLLGKPKINNTNVRLHQLMISYDSNGRLEKFEMLTGQAPDYAPGVPKECEAGSGLPERWAMNVVQSRIDAVIVGVSEKEDVESRLGSPHHWQETDRVAAYYWPKVRCGLKIKYDEYNRVLEKAEGSTETIPEIIHIQKVSASNRH